VNFAVLTQNLAWRGKIFLQVITTETSKAMPKLRPKEQVQLLDIKLRT